MLPTNNDRSLSLYLLSHRAQSHSLGPRPVARTLCSSLSCLSVRDSRCTGLTIDHHFSLHTTNGTHLVYNIFYLNYIISLIYPFINNYGLRQEELQQHSTIRYYVYISFLFCVEVFALGCRSCDTLYFGNLVQRESCLMCYTRISRHMPVYLQTNIFFFKLHQSILVCLLFYLCLYS